MKRLVIAALAGLLTVAMAQRFSVEGSAGLYTGFGGQLAVVAEDFPGLPLGLRLGVGFASTDALDDNVNAENEEVRLLYSEAVPQLIKDFELLKGGQSVTESTDKKDFKLSDAKKGFKLSEWGQNVTVSLDVLYKLAQGQGISVAPYVGVRYNMFSGGYTDPEDKLPLKSVTYSSNAFGFGLGVRAAYPVMPNLSLVGDVGADYYLQACIQKTEVYDSGKSVSSKVCPGHSDYEARNQLVTQPDGWVLKLRLGVAYRF